MFGSDKKNKMLVMVIIIISGGFALWCLMMFAKAFSKFIRLAVSVIGYAAGVVGGGFIAYKIAKGPKLETASN
jgi:hypothetical protein